MPASARLGDSHTCPDHGGGPILPECSTNVSIGNRPAARVGDKARCGPPDEIAQGSPTVLIGGKPAARVGDPTMHGGELTEGCSSVLIGIPGQAACLKAAAKVGAPFVEKYG